MAETQQNFPAGTTDPEATLVQPRFDEAEAQTAQPVVPLSGARLSRARSRLPIALVLVSALLGGLVSVIAYRLYQRPAREPQPATVQQAATQTATPPPPQQQQPAPQPTQTPELTAAVPSAEESAPTSRVETAPAPIKREERDADEEKPARVVEKKHDEEGKAREEAKAREDRRREDEPRAARVAEPRARRVDVIPSYPNDTVDERDTRRVGATDYQLPDDRREGRRGRRPKRRNIDRIRDIFGAPPPA
ncbi:MAG TPA: hypothetical protein VF538_08735 [Pyrinomonadaceae bacterium]|jgi:type IV secretory pathway VirB10-like protein